MYKQWTRDLHISDPTVRLSVLLKGLSTPSPESHYSHYLSPHKTPLPGTSTSLSVLIIHFSLNNVRHLFLYVYFLLTLKPTCICPCFMCVFLRSCYVYIFVCINFKQHNKQPIRRCISLKPVYVFCRVLASKYSNHSSWLKGKENVPNNFKVQYGSTLL